MLTYTYVSKGHFDYRDKEKPTIKNSADAIVKVTLASICSSDLHIKHGSVKRAVPGITVGHEMVGVVEKVGAGIGIYDATADKIAYYKLVDGKYETVK